MIVMKFGGTSVADASRILAVAEIVRERMERGPIVVVSALAGVTDLLVRAVAAARADDRDAVEPILAEIGRRHRWAIADAVGDSRRRHDLSLEFDGIMEELRQLLRSVRILGEGTPRASDALLAFGEILASKIVVAAFVGRGLPARWIDPRGIVVTDGRHGRAEPDVAAIAERGAPLAEAASAGEVPVLGGFVGATRDGHTTTLGRGGSDTSAAVLGAALGAEEIQIWTDVAGILTADPRLVPAARAVPDVSFAEAAELAYYGAKVLHPASIAPAVGRGIPVRVVSSLEPERPGTVVRASRAVSPGSPLASVASRGGVTTVRVEGRSLRMERGFLREVLGALEVAGAGVDLLASSEVAVTAAVSGSLDAGSIAAALGTRVETSDARCIVCLVGAGLSSPEVRAEVASALAAHAPEVLAMGGSATSAAAVFPEERRAEIVRDLHRRFFEAGVAA